MSSKILKRVESRNGVPFYNGFPVRVSKVIESNNEAVRELEKAYKLIDKLQSELDEGESL